MEIKLTPNREAAVAAAAAALKLSSDELIQGEVDRLADAWIYQYIVITREDFIAIKQQNEALEVENAALKAQLGL